MFFTVSLEAGIFQNHLVYVSVAFVDFVQFKILFLLMKLMYCCRYGPPIDSIMITTNELAYEQAKHFDELHTQRTYLGKQSSTKNLQF